MSKAYDISSELGPNLSMTNAWIPEGWTYIGKMIVCPDHKIEVDGIQMSDTNNK